MASTPEWRKGYAKTTHGRAKKLWYRAVVRAKSFNSECTITHRWIQEKLEAGICELTGLPFDLNPTGDYNSNPYSPSLDRIDNTNKNYSPENVRVVLTAVNRTLSEYGEDIMLPILKAMISVMETK